MSIEAALSALPPGLRLGIDVAYSEGGNMVNALMQRGDMEPTRAMMAGLAMNRVGRDLFEDALDEYVRPAESLPNEWPEVVVGGGAHAAIWAATRRRLGVVPLVLERFPRFGGTFAATRQSTFFLNSRNRPGPLGGAGSRDALNVIPGAPMQPSDMSGSEYQANADLGLTVRCTLALNAIVRRAVVTGVVRNGDRLVVMTDRGNVRATRVVMATGIGAVKKFQGTQSDDRLLPFNKFLQRFDKTMFPLRDLGRVAVIGGGDSGRTVVEALTGYGPYLGGSVASLDYVPRIDWYGVGESMTKERWLECNRTRYKPLAALFQNIAGTVQNARVTGFPKAKGVFRTTEGVQVNGQTYDTVVVCLGYFPGLRSAIEVNVGSSFNIYRSGNVTEQPDRGVSLGKVTEDTSFVVIGPAADLPFEESFDPAPRLEENRVALFRLAARTATLASALSI